jgi:hypothetical protein
MNQPPHEDPHPPADPSVDPDGLVDPAPAYLEPGTYDPGAAFLDESQTYADPGQTYADPGQTYADPGQDYTETSGYVDGGFDAPPPPVAPPPAPFQGSVYDEAPAASAPARVPATKKKVTRRGPRPKPVAGRGAPGSRSRRPPQRPVYDSGFSMMTVFLGLVAIAMLGVVAMVFQPREMSEVAGYPSKVSLGGEKPRNLLEEAQRAMIDRSAVLVLSEEEVNRYLNHRLAGEQTGAMSAFVKFRGVYVDFSPGEAEIIVEREFFGMPMTMSARLRNERFRQQIVYKPSGWTIGKISLGARNVKPVIDLFLRMRDTCIDEYHVLQQMREVTFEQNQIALNPVI